MVSFGSFSAFSFASFFFLSFLFVSGEITISPQNTETSVGSTVKLDCTSSLIETSPQTEWHHMGVGATSHELVYMNGDVYGDYYKGRFNVSNGAGNCNLVIRNVTLGDAGRYTCMEVGDAESQKAAELIVFDIYPSSRFCGTRTVCEPVCDAVELFCNMRYRGNMVPFMEWRDSSESILPSTKHTVNDTTTSFIRMKTNKMQTTTYLCSVQYESDSMTSKYLWSYSAQVEPNLTTSQAADAQTSIAVPVMIAVILTFVLAVTLAAVVFYAIYRRKFHRRFRNTDHPGTAHDSAELAAAHSESPNDEEASLMESVSDKTMFVPRTKRNYKKAIYGLTVLEDELFIITRDGGLVEVFDLKTFDFRRYWTIQNLVNPNDMVSSPTKQLLYICDWGKAGEDKVIFCADKHGRFVSSWVSESDKGRLSISKESNVIVAESWYNTIKEYTHCGQLIQRIQTGRQKLHLWHAIKLDSDRFLVSYGDQHDDIQEVVIVDKHGQPMLNFDGLVEKIGGGMSVPRSLAVDKNGTIYVTDLYNARILILTPELKLEGVLTETMTDQRIRGPLRICIGESHSGSQLLVADNKKENQKWGDGRVLTWQIPVVDSMISFKNTTADDIA